MMSDPDPAEFTQWEEEMEEEYKRELKERALLLTDLSLTFSKEAYRTLALFVVGSMPDFSKACELIPLDFSKKNAITLLVYAKRDLIRIWRNILEFTSDEAEARRWLNEEVIDAALTKADTDAMRTVVLMNLEDLNDVKPWNGRMEKK